MEIQLILRIFAIFSGVLQPEVSCVPLSDFLAYGTSAGDLSFDRSDDGLSPPIILSRAFPFHGMSSDLLFVSLASC